MTTYRARHHWWFFIRQATTAAAVLTIGVAAVALSAGVATITAVAAGGVCLFAPTVAAVTSGQARGWAAATAGMGWAVVVASVGWSPRAGLAVALLLAAGQVGFRWYVWSNSWIEISELDVEYTTRDSVFRPRQRFYSGRDKIQNVGATHGTWVEEQVGSWDLSIRTASDGETLAHDLRDGQLVAKALMGDVVALRELRAVPVVERGGGLGRPVVVVGWVVGVGVLLSGVVGLLVGSWLVGLGLVVVVVGVGLLSC